MQEDKAIGDRLMHVRRRIEAACERVGRSPDEVTIVAVTKTLPLEKVQSAITAGIAHIGENRVQEARRKLPHTAPEVTRHLIGPLQTNKARFVPSLFEWVHSVDRKRLATELGRRAEAADQSINVLLQVNVSGEGHRHGAAPGELEALAAAAGRVSGIKVKGLMTMAPFTEDEAEIRDVFRSLRQLFEQLKTAAIDGVEMKHLSMGMTNDFEIAVEEGATMVRLGSAIFGPRE